MSVQRVILRPDGGAHYMPRVVVVATGRLAECTQLLNRPDRASLVRRLGLGELGDTSEYNTTRRYIPVLTSLWADGRECS